MIKYKTVLDYTCAFYHNYHCTHADHNRRCIVLGSEEYQQMCPSYKVTARCEIDSVSCDKY
jgi:hypothetical protein